MVCQYHTEPRCHSAGHSLQNPSVNATCCQQGPHMGNEYQDAPMLSRNSLLMS